MNTATKETEMTTEITAFALTTGQAEAMGAEASGIFLQEFDVYAATEERPTGEEFPTGREWTLDGDTSDEDAMDATLEANGYRRVGQWVESGVQMIATVERI